MILDDEFGGQWETNLPAGALIGVVNVVACKRTEDVTGGLGLRNARPEQYDDYRCGDFTDGRYAWKRREFRVFERPIPHRGAQGIFNVPDSMIGMERIAGMLEIEMAELFAVPRPNEERPEPLPGGRRRGR